MKRTIEFMMIFSLLMITLSPVMGLELGFAQGSHCTQADEDARDPSPPPSPNGELDLNNDNKISEEEFYFAVELWVTCQPIPGTSQYLSDRDIDELYALWQSS